MKKTVLMVFTIFLFSHQVFAQKNFEPLWGDKGIIVNDAIGNTLQQNSKIAKTGSSEYISVWEDQRSGNSDIYIQKLDERGDHLWGKNGIPLCTAPNEQIFPQIVADGLGGAYISWQDNRSGEFQVYLQRVDADGTPLFREGGIPICPLTGGQVFPEIISDGQGGVIVSWQDYRVKEEDVYAQRIDANGNLLWEPDGAAICREKGTQRPAKMISDGQGGSFIAWTDRRSLDFDIYAQHISFQGKASWANNGIPICLAPGNQDNPKIVSNGKDGFYISWSDARLDSPGIYVQNVSLAGINSFVENGLRVANIFSGSDIPEMIAGPAQDAIILWTDPYAGDSDIYMQKISSDGKLAWGEEAKPLAKVRGSQENPKIYGQAPYYYIVWEDLRNSVREIFLQKIDQDGNLSFIPGGMPISKDQHGGQSFDLVFGEDLSSIICYQDDKHGNFDIFAQKIDKDGNFSWGIFGKLVNGSPGSVIQQNFKAVSDNHGNIYFSFEDRRLGYPNIYVQKLDPEGLLLWKKDGIAAASGEISQLNSDIVHDGMGGAYVVWEDQRDSSGSKIYIQHFNPQGDPAWPLGRALTPAATVFNQKKPKIVSDGANGAIVVFADTRDVLNAQDIFSQRVSPKGELLFSNLGKRITSGNGVQDDPIISPNSFVVAWTDYRNGDRNSDIFAQKIALNGKTLWEEDGMPICEAPDSQREPALVNDKEGGVIIVWTDRGGGNFDIFAQKVDNDGRSMWLKDGVPVCQTGMTQQRPKIAIVSAGLGFVVWEDFKLGNWDIIGQTLNLQGRVSISEEGISLCSVQGTQYAPDLVTLGKNFLAAWEDYRSNSAYNIYMQAFTPDGAMLWEQGGVLANETRFGARSPKLISFGNNTFLLAWEDNRNGGRAIAAQKYRY